MLVSDDIILAWCLRILYVKVYCAPFCLLTITELFAYSEEGVFATIYVSRL